ncbi:MAG: malto-oligosyltrehalose synthase [Actinomycetota bacterium]|nr:malto-oligosyltrehalose synthase [Actinomycetota bacterium]
MRREFTFDDLAAQLDYLAALGVSHVYLSPILQAVPGSTHGYDVVDHSQLSEDLGGGEGFVRLFERMVETGLGAVVDVVPNHVAVPTPATLNAPLWSVLREGPHSPYAGWFDIDWDLQEGAILMPVLGKRIGECLRDGELTLDRSGAEPVLRYYDHVFPVRPGTESLPLAELIERQWYRLAYWRVADEELNYRRFFDVDTLAGLRVEREEVFAESHALLVAMVREGSLDGLRIDHPDGLADPRGYLRRLYDATDGSWIVVEKILEGHEALPDDWPCAGTTGYDALQQVMGVLTDPAGGPTLTTLYSQLTGEPADFAVVVEEAKRWVVEHGLYAEVNRLVELAHAMCQDHVELRDHTRRGLREALVELLVAFPVYRAYVAPGEEPPERSVVVLTEAAERAKAHLAEEQHATVELLRDLALGRHGRGRHRDEFVVRFQQTCGPVMAKGVEDTSFYRWFRLSALNEVGGDPGHLGRTVEEFHDWCTELQRDWPASMTTLSTHDTKRAEDVRARLIALSELPEEWGGAVTSWRATASHYRPDALDANTEYLLWQTLVGAWPLTEDRLIAYLEKATREAKRHTSWTDQNAEYDEAVRSFARAVLAGDDVRKQIEDFLGRLEPAVRCNVLAQKLVQLTMPGVPDVYQGTELVELSLVDPDNRRPVDYSARRGALSRLDGGAPPRDLDEEKLLVTSRALRVRRKHPDWFGTGSSYSPLPTTSAHALAFVRSGSAVTIATRLSVTLDRAGGWGDATVALPEGSWRDVLTGRSYDGGDVALGELLSAYPVALLVRQP